VDTTTVPIVMFVPVHAMMAYGGMKVYLSGNPGGSQNGSRCFEEEKKNLLNLAENGTIIRRFSSP
jgi:hypothetical protein